MNYIYKITNHVNGKQYIGFTSLNPEARFKEHMKGDGGAILIEKAVKKYGPDKFSYEVLEESEDRKYLLHEREEYYIRFFKTHSSEGGYNRSFGGTANRRGKKATPEQRLAMSISRTGKRRPPSFAEKMKVKMKGRAITWGEKISKTLSGTTLSESTKEKMRGKRGPQMNYAKHLVNCPECGKELDKRGLTNHTAWHSKNDV